MLLFIYIILSKILVTYVYNKNKKHKTWVSKDIINEGKLIREVFKLSRGNSEIKEPVQLTKK